MSKLGYTWYPKDWGNSEAVFELDLTQRGFYRELIDMAMLNDNTTIINFKVWSRKFSSNEKELHEILVLLDSLELIIIDEDSIFINSCEARLNLSRGGRKGGKKSAKNKPTPKPTPKPLLSLDENNDKPTPNQRKVNIKESKVNINIELDFNKFLEWFNLRRTSYIEKPSNIKRLTREQEITLGNLKKSYSTEDFELAMYNLCNDKWANENNQILCSFFLKTDIFNKFLSTEKAPMKTKEQRRRAGWII